MSRESDILAALPKATSGEARQLVAELDAIRAGRREAKAADASLDWSDDVVARHDAPADGFVRHTAATDWLMGAMPDDHDPKVVHQAAKAAATEWYRGTSKIARVRESEYRTQALLYAESWGSQYGTQTKTAVSSFVQQALHLAGFRMIAAEEEDEADRTGDTGPLEAYLDENEKEGSLRTAAEGQTCSVCGDAIAQTDGEWHHDNGEKHDHEAEPGGESKEGSQRTAISLDHVGLDGPGVGIGTDPSGNRVRFRLTEKEESDLKFVLYSDLAVNFSGVEIEEGDIISEGARRTAGAPSDVCPKCGEHMDDVVVTGDTLKATCDACGWSGTKTKKTSTYAGPNGIAIPVRLLSETCETCGAAPGEPCIGGHPSGPVSWFHAQDIAALKTESARRTAGKVHCNECGNDFVNSSSMGASKCPKCSSTDLRTTSASAPKGPQWFEDNVYDPPKVTNGVPLDLFPDGGVPLSGDLTPEQEAWLKKRSSLAPFGMEHTALATRHLANSEDEYDDLADWPAAEKTIDALRDIVTSFSAKMVDGVFVDVQSANAIVTVYDALNDENKAKLLALPIDRMGEVAWKLVSKSGAKTALTKTAAVRPISEIAAEIEADWGARVNYAARPYLDAMYALNSISDMYYQDPGSSIVAYFLSNASSWRGETAKRVKKELNDMLSGKLASLSKSAAWYIIAREGSAPVEGPFDTEDEARRVFDETGYPDEYMVAPGEDIGIESTATAWAGTDMLDPSLDEDTDYDGQKDEDPMDLTPELGWDSEPMYDEDEITDEVPSGAAANLSSYTGTRHEMDDSLWIESSQHVAGMDDPVYAEGFDQGYQDAAAGRSFNLHNSPRSSESTFAEGYYAGYDAFSAIPREANQKMAMPNPVDLGVKMGDIFVSSWGYDQTNVDFYEVVGLTGASVKVRQVRQQFVSRGAQYGDKVIPVPGDYVGEVMTKRIQQWGDRPSFTVSSYANAYLWDGTPQYQTDSMFGH